MFLQLGELSGCRLAVDLVCSANGTGNLALIVRIELTESKFVSGRRRGSLLLCLACLCLLGRCYTCRCNRAYRCDNIFFRLRHTSDRLRSHSNCACRSHYRRRGRNDFEGLLFDFLVAYTGDGGRCTCFNRILRELFIQTGNIRTDLFGQIKDGGIVSADLGIHFREKLLFGFGITKGVCENKHSRHRFNRRSACVEFFHYHIGGIALFLLRILRGFFCFRKCLTLCLCLFLQLGELSGCRLAVYLVCSANSTSHLAFIIRIELTESKFVSRGRRGGFFLGRTCLGLLLYCLTFGLCLRLCRTDRSYHAFRCALLCIDAFKRIIQSDKFRAECLLFGSECLVLTFLLLCL